MTHLEALRQHEKEQQVEKGFDIIVGLFWFVVSLWLGNSLLSILAILVGGVAVSTIARIAYLNSRS
jgi:hypothetical protein